MLKVAILDDYQNIAQDFVDLKKLSGKYEIEIFNAVSYTHLTLATKRIV